MSHRGQELLAAAALHDAKIVALGDKLSNMRAIARDYAQQGDSLWNLFHAKDPKDHEWHYRGLADITAYEQSRARLLRGYNETKGITTMMQRMRLWMMVAILTICGSSGLTSCSKDDNASIDTSVLDQWQAGETVSQKTVEAFGGIDKCFAAEPIPDGVWERMQGKTFKENPYIGRADLRHVRALHWDYDDQMHVGEMVCNVQIADRLVTILRKLFDAKYPIQRMLLPDVYNADDETQMRDNNSSCFCYRNIAATNNLSKHARGLAVDINTLYNPYIKTLEDGTLLIEPATGEPYCDRSWDFPYKITHDDFCFKFFTEAGFEWGGDWTNRKDYQHFEIKE